WRQFIMGFPIHIIKVAINPELIVTDLGFKSRVATPTFLFREGSLEQVKVKPRKQAEGRPSTRRSVNIIACRSQAISKIWRRPELQSVRSRDHRTACRCHGCVGQLKIVRAGVRTQKWRNRSVGPVLSEHRVMVIEKHVAGDTR